jgi:hypothetical protein
VESVQPAASEQPGQVVLLNSGALGMCFRVRFDVDRVDPATYDLEFRAQFPLGIRMQEHISVRSVDGGSRVQYG